MLTTILLLPFATALLLALLPAIGKRAAATLAGIGTLTALALLLGMGPTVFDGTVVKSSTEWIPSLGLAFSLRVDGFAFMFALLVLGIGALIVLYAAYYLSDSDPPERFFAYLMFFMGAMLGVTISGNLLLLVLFWELTSISSFLLIGYWNQRHDARAGARMAFAITGGGGLCLLAGVLLIGHIVGSYELDVVLAAGDAIRAHALYLPALLLILMGAFTKSAQFPFHFWLPHAMAAPTPVSAYLHSATMVKCGVFLIARMYPALAGTEEWFFLVTGFGLITMFVGAYLALIQQDLKGLLAYSTISHLGLITLLFGMNSPVAVVAGVFHIINHATFKASLFMAAGIIDHETGTRDFRKLGGLWRYMPWTGTLAIIAAAAMAGVPLFNGFLSKEMFLEQALKLETGRYYDLVVPGLALLASVFSVAYSLRFIHDVFFAPSPTGFGNHTPHEPPRFMKVPVEALVILCILVGLFPNLIVGSLLAASAGAVLGGPLPEYKLAIWHGFNLPLLFSAIALAGGIGLYFFLQRRNRLHAIDRASRGKRTYDAQIAALIGAARRVTATLETGSFTRYAVMLFATVLGAALFGLLPQWPTVGPVANQPIDALSLMLLLCVLVGTWGTVRFHADRLLALIVVGVVGLAVSLTFVLLSAPDLALTQLLVEIVTIVLLLLALRYLPQTSKPEPKSAARWLHAALAIGTGVFTAWVSWLILTRPAVPQVPEYMLARTIAEGGGANAVNVILVDFRGFDTLGEIAVFGIAALAIYAALKGGRAEPRAEEGRRPRTPVLLNRASDLLLPFAVLVSFYLFLRGHNVPGGGFIGGLVLGIAMAMQYLAIGRERFESAFRTDWNLWIGWGVLIAALTGVGSWVLGYPFLTSTTPYVDLPLLGKVPFASAMAFDTGVYLVVIGGTVLMLAALIRLERPAAPAAIQGGKP